MNPMGIGFGAVAGLPNPVQNKIKSALKLLDDMWCYVGGDADETAQRILERREAFKKPAVGISCLRRTQCLLDAI